MRNNSPPTLPLAGSISSPLRAKRKGAVRNGVWASPKQGQRVKPGVAQPCPGAPTPSQLLPCGLQELPGLPGPLLRLAAHCWGLRALQRRHQVSVARFLSLPARKRPLPKPPRASRPRPRSSAEEQTPSRAPCAPLPLEGAWPCVWVSFLPPRALQSCPPPSRVSLAAPSAKNACQTQFLSTPKFTIKAEWNDADTFLCVIFPLPPPRFGLEHLAVLTPCSPEGLIPPFLAPPEFPHPRPNCQSRVLLL